MIRALRVGIPILVIALAVMSFSASPALAGKTGRATLTLSPNPAPPYDYFQAAGCGYVADKMVNITIDRSDWLEFFPVGMPVNGCILFSEFTGSPGTYKVNAYQAIRHIQILMASASLQVE